MEFEKRFMKRTELVKMGFPEEMLDRAYRDPKQRFASKINPAKKNSTIIFDTEALGRWWDRQIAIQRAVMRR